MHCIKSSSWFGLAVGGTTEGSVKVPPTVARGGTTTGATTRGTFKLGISSAERGMVNCSMQTVGSWGCSLESSTSVLHPMLLEEAMSDEFLGSKET